ncbi:MAG: thioredoxin domain-containing protein, partial [bacterium]
VDSRGGFHSAEDADSPLPENPEAHGEGAFYVWTKKEIFDILDSHAGEIFSFRYGVEEAGNALSDPLNEFTGKNLLYVANSLDSMAARFERPVSDIERILQEARQKLFAVRSKRPRPHLDDKVITSWNGLMIGAFARGYQVLNQPRYLEAAERAANFVMSDLYDSGKKILLRRYRDGASGLEAHLNDYAFFVNGLLDLYEASLDVKWLVHALELTEKQVSLFWDEEAGGFYDTSGKDKTVLLRMKEDYDGAEPTGNSIAALNLLRLSQMTDNEDWYQKGAKTVSAFGNRLQQIPSAMPQMLAALDYRLDKPKQIIIAGKPGADDTQKMLTEVYERYIPNKIILLADGGKAQKVLAKHLPFIESVGMIDGKATAYICENYVCHLPTSDVDVMVGLLEE